MKTFKTYLWLICAIFMVASCGTSKKTKKLSTVEKTTVKVDKIEKDSVTEIKEVELIKKDSIIKIEKVLPTESEVILNLDDLNGDFSQSTSSGDGSGTTIKKVGNKLIITTKTSGSENKETIVETVDETTKETNTTTNEKIETNEKESVNVVNTSEIVIVKTPFWLKFWFWIIIVILILIFIFRKNILTIAGTIFPPIKMWKIFSSFFSK